MNQILVIHTDGGITPIQQEAPPTLKQVQDWVKGYVQPVGIDPTFGKEMYVNEEGLLDNLPENKFATILAQIPVGTHLVGDAVVFVNFSWE